MATTIILCVLCLMIGACIGAVVMSLLVAGHNAEEKYQLNNMKRSEEEKAE